MVSALEVPVAPAFFLTPVPYNRGVRRTAEAGNCRTMIFQGEVWYSFFVLEVRLLPELAVFSFFYCAAS